MKIEPLEHRLLFTVFSVTNNLSSGAGSLRQAILDANANGGADEIDFNIASGSKQILVTSVLPNITDDLTIDGTTQPGFTNKPLVEINGTHCSVTANGLDVAGSASLTLKDVAITSFGAAGLVLNSTAQSVIQGNNIGIDSTGTIARGNGQSGIIINDSSGNTIGGITAGQGNIIADNGVRQKGAAGVLVIGGGNDNAIRGNSIFGNRGVGIDLAASGTLPDGQTANDAGDADTGNNNLQNFPVLTTAFLDTGHSGFVGTFNSQPNQTYHIDIYGSPVEDFGNPQAHVYIGSQDLTTDASGNGFINITLPTSSFTSYTATATDASGNTSELSKAETSSSGNISGFVFLDNNANGVFDKGDTRLDLAIVYVDLNNDNLPEPNEPFIFTDQGGDYVLPNVPGGVDRVKIVAAQGQAITTPAAGYYKIIEPTASSEVHKNFTLTQPAVIKGHVFEDVNRNGVQNGTEPNLVGWTIYIDKNNDGVLDTGDVTTSTDPSGNYRFGSLTAGTYVIRVSAKKGFTTTFHKVTVVSDQTKSNQNFPVTK